MYQEGLDFEGKVDDSDRLMASLLTTQDSRLCNITQFHFKWLVLAFSSAKQNKSPHSKKSHPMLCFSQDLKESHPLFCDAFAACKGS